MAARRRAVGGEIPDTLELEMLSRACILRKEGLYLHTFHSDERVGIEQFAEVALGFSARISQ